MPGWVEAARRRLLDLRGEAPGWGYRPGSAPCVEATVLACLALLATDTSETSDESASSVEQASAWLARLQQPDGSLGVSAQAAVPHWPTAWAVLLWSARSDHGDERQRALGWMLESRGEVEARSPYFGHDSTIVGWPWLAGTHAWLEPTSVAVIALRGAGLADHERARDGVRLIRDRALSSGGWNYGNTTVFDKELRPRPAPTGLALLALAGLEPASAPVEAAWAYLESALPTIRSGQSCCWGLLGLAAWGRRPQASGAWLADAADRASRRSNLGVELAYLMLASQDRTLALLGAGA
jgi:hypothetical protein